MTRFVLSSSGGKRESASSRNSDMFAPRVEVGYTDKPLRARARSRSCRGYLRGSYVDVPWFESRLSLFYSVEKDELYLSINSGKRTA